jgi:exopolysaccharide biosynthesis protein
MKFAQPKFLSAMFAIALLGSFSANATNTVNPWVPAFKGIDYTTGEADTNELHQLKIFAFRVDLSEPTIELFSTPSNGTNALETFGQTTTTFVNTYHVAVGMNANFFSPVTTIPNDPRDLSGLAISQGDIVSPFESGRAISMLFTRDNKASIVTAAQASYTNYWTAVSGSDRILINGVAQKQSCTTDFCNENPRSALGLSSDKRYLILMVIDGRRAGWSDGSTLYETGQWLFRLGAWNGINLDGGGSTALAKMQNGSAVLMNKPSGGVQRVDGNHIGIFAQNLAPVIVTQPTNSLIGFGQNATFAVNAGGTTPLKYQWRFNGVDISKATNNSYTRSNVQLAQLGYYSVVVSNSAGFVTSANAALISTNPPTPPKFTSASVVSNGTIRLFFAADVGRNYEFQTSSNLVQWTAVTNWFNQVSSTNFIFNMPGNSPRRFYRVLWVP